MNLEAYLSTCTNIKLMDQDLEIKTRNTETREIEDLKPQTQADSPNKAPKAEEEKPRINELTTSN